MKIGLEIAYAPTFQPNALPVSVKNLVYERCGVLFNLAALYSQLAASEDRSRIEGIKRATAYHQVSHEQLRKSPSSWLMES